MLFYDLFNNKDFNYLAFTDKFWLSRCYYVLTENWKKEKKLLKISWNSVKLTHAIFELYFMKSWKWTVSSNSERENESLSVISCELLLQKQLHIHFSILLLPKVRPRTNFKKFLWLFFSSPSSKRSSDEKVQGRENSSTSSWETLRRATLHPSNLEPSTSSEANNQTDFFQPSPVGFRKKKIVLSFQRKKELGILPRQKRTLGKRNMKRNVFFELHCNLVYAHIFVITIYFSESRVELLLTNFSPVIQPSFTRWKWNMDKNFVLKFHLP